MDTRYYARRRLNPYRGVSHIVDVGDAIAHTYDGITWYLRGDDGFGWVRPTGIWVEGEGLKAGRGSHPELLAALENHPPLPFPSADHMELWLLDKESGLPLALLASELPSRFRPERIEPEWHPFVLTYTAYRSPVLAERDRHTPQPAAHRDVLARQVNNSARPHPAAQWFRRHADGSGEGLAGLRLEHAWHERTLPPDDFPELLVREHWNNRVEQSVINDYHTWVAPLLLMLPRLSDATRDRLEALAAEKPRWLLKVHRLIPHVVQPERFRAALVAARLEAAGAGEEDSIFDS